MPIGGVWSKGCDLHKTGTCRPCHYVATKAGCMNGAECEFCHLPHPRRARQRPCKTKRLQSDGPKPCTLQSQILGLTPNRWLGRAEAATKCFGCA